ncbi:MAG: LysM peptidoglycan-binding domain-containing protein [Acidimicrobiia bacterium]
MTASIRPEAMRLLVLRLLVLALAVAAVFLLLASVGAAESPPAPTRTYVVASGDTLWSIAQSVTEPGQDLRPVIDVISDLNHLDGDGIAAGQALLIPGSRTH